MPTTQVVCTISSVPVTEQSIQDAWYNGLNLAAQGKIAERWNQIVGSEVKWAANVASISNKRWKPMIASDWVSVRDRSAAQVKGIQLRKLTAAFAKAKTDFDLMFANGAASYVERITNKAGHFSSGVARTLAATGARVRGQRGPTSVVVRVLNSDVRAARDQVAGQITITGPIDPRVDVDPGHHRWCKDYFGGFAAAGFEGRLIQAAVLIMTGDIPTAEIAGVNDILTQLLGAMLRTNYVAGSGIAFANSPGGFNLTLTLSGDDPL